MLSALNGKDAPWGVLLGNGNGCAAMGSRMAANADPDHGKPPGPVPGTLRRPLDTQELLKRLISPDRMAIVLDGGRAGNGPGSGAFSLIGEMAEQFLERGTAAASLLALSYILDQDPGAIVCILPSSQTAFPGKAFIRYAILAYVRAGHLKDRLVVLGAVPKEPVAECTWIAPGKEDSEWVSEILGLRPMKVAGFRENPTKAEARHLFTQGCLLDTGIVIGSAAALWRLSQRLLPDQMEHFMALREVIRAVRDGRADRKHEVLALRHTSSVLQAADLSRDVLFHAASDMTVFPMFGVQWIESGHLPIGREPAEKPLSHTLSPVPPQE